MKELSLFESILFEAPTDEDPPDIVTNEISTTYTSDDTPIDNDPVIQDNEDIEGVDNIGGDVSFTDSPPDMTGASDDGASGDFGEEPLGSDSSEEDKPDLKLDDKISAIQNQGLYQEYLKLLNNIGTRLSAIRSNSDILYSLNDDTIDVVQPLKRLDENVRLYLYDRFLQENYAVNLLFFNKCLNMLELLDKDFGRNVEKGIRDLK